MWEILFRHPDFVAINKPQGVSVHQEEGEVSLTQTLAAQLGLEQVGCCTDWTNRPAACCCLH